VNAELISMYWRIGALILERQAAQGGVPGWSSGSPPTCGQFPTVRGVGRRNLHYLRAFAEAWPEKVQQPAAQLPWSHIMVLLGRLEDRLGRAQATEVSMA